MLQHTGGIVLQRYKYTDSKVIAKVYTEKYGLISCLFFGTNTPKGRGYANLLQPLYLTDLSIYHKEAGNLQKVKEISMRSPFTIVSPDIIKNAVSLFLAEFLMKTIKENEPDQALFDFLAQSVKELNETEESISNFHLIFLFQLSKYLGIMPLNTYSDSHAIFDLRLGKFIMGQPDHSNFLNLRQSELFYKLFEHTTAGTGIISISYKERKDLLDAMISYYTIHLDRPGELKSLKVLQEVFSG
jgi:DNA repair protein RecO (recombination protein O)